MDKLTAGYAFSIAFMKQSNIHNLIDKVASEGKFEITLPFVLMSHLRDKLKEEGYSVTLVEDKQTIINWYFGRDPILLPKEIK